MVRRAGAVNHSYITFSRQSPQAGAVKPGAAAITSRENILHLRGSPLPLAHFDKRPHEDTDHILQEAIPDEIHDQLSLRHMKRDLLHITHTGLLHVPISTERLEVVPALQKMRGLFHGRNIERFSQLPHIAPREYVLFTAGANAVTIEFSCRRETAMKTLTRYPHARHTDVIRQKTVQLILQLPDGSATES